MISAPTKIIPDRIPEYTSVCESRIKVSQRVNELASESVSAVELASARTPYKISVLPYSEKCAIIMCIIL